MHMDNFSFLGLVAYVCFRPLHDAVCTQGHDHATKHLWFFNISIVKENHALYFPNCKTHFVFLVENVRKILHILVYRCMSMT